MPGWVWIFALLFGALLSIKLAYVLGAGLVLPVTRGALFIPSSSRAIRAFLKAVPMGPEELFMDLGCGDGRVLCEARKRYGVMAFGFEVNLLAYVMARFRAFGSKGIQIRWRNFWKEDLSHADVVFCYLFPDVMAGLAKKLEGELRPGTRVVSCNFPLSGWHPSHVLHPHEEYQGDPIYIYEVPCALGSFNQDMPEYP